MTSGLVPSDNGRSYRLSYRRVTLGLKLSSAALGATLVAGCATLAHGTVAKKLDNDAARIYLGSADGIASGQRLGLYEQRCHQRFLDGLDVYDQVCDQVRVGGGTVTTVLAKDEALMRVDPGVAYGFGTIVKPDAASAH